MTARRIATGALLLLLAIGAPVAPLRSQSIENKIEQKQSDLDRIKKEMDTLRAERERLGKQEQAVLGKIKTLDKDIDLTQTYLRELREQEALLTTHIDSVARDIVRQTMSLEDQRARLGRRLRQLYMRDPHYRWDIILGSESIDQAVLRYKFMKIIAEQDAAMVAGVVERKQRLATQQASMTESLADVSEVRGQREAEGVKLAAARDERTSSLKSIQSKRSEHAKAIKELEKAQKEVQDLLGALEKRRVDGSSQYDFEGGNFAALKGKMIWPVNGRVSRKFGKQTHPRYGTVTFNNGIDIAAERGTPIVAVAPGLIEYVDWIDAYGKCIIINHGDGYYTLYAHVSTTFVRQGQKVAGAEVIAEVGDTGSLDGFECHFEVRKAREALDPMTWLSAQAKQRTSG